MEGVDEESNTESTEHSQQPAGILDVLDQLESVADKMLTG
jgi:hypothetical protein